MARESGEEKKVVGERFKQFSGKPHKSMTGEYSLKEEIPGHMKTPKAPGDSNKQMGGDHKGMRADMGRARERLEHETERGKHAPSVGGHKMGCHGGRMDD